MKLKTTPINLPNDIREALERLRKLNDEHELLQFTDLPLDYHELEDHLSMEFLERFDTDPDSDEDQPMVEFLSKLEDAIEEERILEHEPVDA